MPPTRSSYIADKAPKKRTRLATWWVVSAFLLIATTSLIVLFPREAQTRLQALAAHDDLVATEYLRGVLKHHPDDVEVRFELVERAIRAGDKTTALRLLQAVKLSDSKLAVRAIMLTAGIQEIELIESEAGSATYLARLNALRSTLDKAFTHATAEQIDTAWLSDKLAKYLPARLPDLYQIMAKQEPGRAPYWLEQTAQAALGNGRYQAAADAYFLAMQKSRDPHNAHRYFLAGLKTLQSGNMNQAALDAAQRYGAPYLNDRDTLIYLIKLARASGRRQEADHYARLLVRMSLLEHLAPQHALAAWRAGLSPVSTSLEFIRSAGTPTLPFDEEAYTLAYEVFVDNKKFEDALALIHAALKARPNDRIWLRRLAQLSEWSGHAEQALAAWRKLALSTNSAEAWQAMARLAPGLLADEDLLLLWQREIAQRSLSEAEWLTVKFIYERLGKPIEGAQFLEQHAKKQSTPLLLEQAAYLRESMGDLDGALQDYALLAQRFGPKVKWALPEAALLYTQNQTNAALEALKRALPDAKADDYAYWRVVGDLAWSLNQTELARHAYQYRQTAPDWQKPDTDRLLELIAVQDVEGRLAVSRAAWQRSRHVRYLNIALNILLDRQQVEATRQLLSEITPQENNELKQEHEFLVQRARYYLLINARAKARADLARANQLNPSAEIKISLLWLLIDSRDLASLRETLPRWENLIAENPSMADVIAAGWLSLGHPQRALRWSTPMLAAHQQDLVWLSNYADMLEQTGQTDAATQLRQGLWLNHRTKTMRDIDSLLQHIRLALQFEPIDKAEKQLFRQLLNQHSPLPASANPDQDIDRLNALADAWFKSRNNDSRARFWLWRRYVSQHAMHANAPNATASYAERRQQRASEVAEALASNEREDSAYERGERGIALSEAWQQLKGAPDNDNLHQQYAAQWLGQRPSGLSARSDYLGGDISGWQHGLQHRGRLAPQLLWQLTLEQGQKNWDAQAYRQTQQGVDLSLSHLAGDDALWQLTLGQRKAWATTTSAVLRSEGRHYGWHYAAQYDWNRPSNDSNALSLAGMQRQWQLEGGYQFAPNWDSRLRIGQARLLTQDGLAIGQRQDSELSMNWTAAQTGSWSAELRGQRSAYQLTPYLLSPLDTSLPQSYSRIQATLGYGMVYQENYTRAWRPFMSATIGRHSIFGQEISWQLGIAGSVLGKDHLSLYGGSTVQNTGRNTPFGGVYYQWLY